MRAVKILQDGKEIGYAINSEVAIKCAKISWSAFKEGTWAIYAHNAIFRRKGFKDVNITFEPIDVWEIGTHL